MAEVCDRIRGGLFDAQLRLLDEERTWSVASCGRQAGKNYTVTRLLISTALERSDANCAYVNATYGEARRIMWGDPIDGIPAVLRELMPGGGYRLNESRLEVTFSNGSRIELLGADRGAWEKLRGNKFDLVVVDECQKLEDEGFRNALDKVLPDTLVARKGRFVGIGTPDEFCVGAFHDICTGVRGPDGLPLYPQFVVHHWDASENDRRPDIWAAQLAWKAERNLADDDPVWLREKRGLWVRQDSSLILPLSDRSLWDGQLPATVPSRTGTQVPRSETPTVYAGCDFGWTDAFAVTVGSVSREEGVLRELHSFKRSHLNTREVADVMRRMMSDYGVRVFYGDAAAAGQIADLQQLYSLPVVAVQKHEKTLWIQEMRTHLLEGRLQVLRGSVLHEELRVLSPDPDELKRKRIETRPGSDDHTYDSFRYLVRGVWTNHVKAPEPPESAAERQEREARERKEKALEPITRKPGISRRTIG